MRRYMADLDFGVIERVFGVAMKVKHTIVEKWPLRLKLRPGQQGAQEEFEMLRSSDHSGIERYVEWKRTK